MHDLQKNHTLHVKFVQPHIINVSEFPYAAII